MVVPYGTTPKSAMFHMLGTYVPRKQHQKKKLRLLCITTFVLVFYYAVHTVLVFYRHKRQKAKVVIWAKPSHLRFMLWVVPTHNFWDYVVT